MSTNIVQIKIKLGSKEIELTADEAREVYSQLKLLFVQANENPLIAPYPIPVYPQPTYIQPIIWNPCTWPAPYHTEITCLADGNSILNITS